jgi:hypothetical protein
MPDKTIVQKISIKRGSKFLLVNPPEGYTARLGVLPSEVHLLSQASSPVEAIQVFAANHGELEAQLHQLKPLLSLNGMLWVTYHKGTSKVKTNINRDTIVAYAKTLDLHGVAMISIDEDWSALRLKHIQT